MLDGIDGFQLLNCGSTAHFRIPRGDDKLVNFRLTRFDKSVVCKQSSNCFFNTGTTAGIKKDVVLVFLQIHMPDEVASMQLAG